MLFGKMLEGGIRSHGLIDQFESIDVDPRKACEMVADELVRKGIFEDAIRLYDLAGVSTKSGRRMSLCFVLKILYNLTRFLLIFFSRLKSRVCAI